MTTRYVDPQRGLFVRPRHNGVKKQWDLYLGRIGGGSVKLGTIYETSAHRRYRVNMTDEEGRTVDDFFTGARNLRDVAVVAYHRNGARS